jgi:ribose/xylose/arabinose/galactoside ABC-type transport system permease subunit
VPSTRNFTPTTPTLSEAVAVMVTVPETVVLLAGPVMLTVGALVSSVACGAAAITCAKADGAGVAALATSAVTGADNAVIDGSARACRSP